LREGGDGVAPWTCVLRAATSCPLSGCPDGGHGRTMPPRDDAQWLGRGACGQRRGLCTTGRSCRTSTRTGAARRPRRRAAPRTWER
jgi:hypothetical protein